MHKHTGEIVDMEKVEKMPKDEQQEFVGIERELSKSELESRKIGLYDVCGCGSGKKFRFCCYRTRTGDKPHNFS